MRKKHLVKLSEDERTGLESLIRGGTARVRVIRRALVLLAADDGDTDVIAAGKARVSLGTVVNVRRRFAEDGLQATLSERPRPGKQPKLDGRQEAYVVALACSEPPDGRARWTLRLLARRLVELEIADEISHHTVGRLLKRGNLNPGAKSSGALQR